MYRWYSVSWDWTKWVKEGVWIERDPENWWSGKNAVEGLMLIDVKVYYDKGTVIMICYKDRQTGQWNGMERPDVSPHIDNWFSGAKGIL